MQCNNDDVRFELNQHPYFDSTSSLKQYAGPNLDVLRSYSLIQYA